VDPKQLMEQTLIILKPDAVMRGLCGEILARFERSGLKIVAMKLVYANEQNAKEHYFDDEAWLKSLGEKTLKAYEKKGTPLNKTPLEQGHIVRNWLISYMTMGPVLVFILEGHNAVAHVRKIVGSTAPADALPGTIRGDYAFESFVMGDVLERPIQNLIHASGAVDEAKREIAVWFKPEEIHVWSRIEDSLFYRKG